MRCTPATSIGKSNSAIAPCSWCGEKVTNNKVALGLLLATLCGVAMTSRGAGEGRGGRDTVVVCATIIGATTILTLGIVQVGNRIAGVMEQVGHGASR